MAVQDEQYFEHCIGELLISVSEAMAECDMYWR